jgi:L-fuculose-phosphate aldolase
MYQQIKKIGEKLFQRGLNNSHSGNISVRINERICISKTGSSLDMLGKDDVVEVGLNPDKEMDKNASMELLVHRAIYDVNEKVWSVVHAHPPYAVALAHKKKKIIPYDQEGQYYLKEIPVIRAKQTLGSKEIAEQIGSYVKDYKAVIIEKHGVFTWGETLEDAYHYMTVVESVCKINYLVENKSAS